MPINRLALAVIFISGFSSAQVGVVVAPATAPVGCPFVIAISNDTNQTIWLPTPCPFVVKDLAGTYVHASACISVAWPIAPGDTYVSTWDQTENFYGNPVAPGSYVIEVPTFGVSQSVVIAGNGSALAPRGVSRIGTNRTLQLCAPTEAGRPYVAAASFGPPLGLPTCGGVAPLSIDTLLFFSLVQPNSIFQNFTGVLDNSGTSILPSLNIPNDPNLVGLQIALAFVTFDPASPCQIRVISSPATVTIQ